MMKKIIVSFSIAIIGCINLSFGQTTNASIKNGQVLYTTFCASCHMENGNGMENTFPSLVKTNFVINKNMLVKIISQGMRGPIDVKGAKFDAEMAGTELTDKEVADLANYIRNSWGNKAPLIQPSEVATAKKTAVKGHQPY